MWAFEVAFHKSTTFPIKKIHFIVLILSIFCCSGAFPGKAQWLQKVTCSCICVTLRHKMKDLVKISDSEAEEISEISYWTTQIYLTCLRLIIRDLEHSCDFIVNNWQFVLHDISVCDRNLNHMHHMWLFTLWLIALWFEGFKRSSIRLNESFKNIFDTTLFCKSNSKSECINNLFCEECTQNSL
jgi:hypothetical protein